MPLYSYVVLLAFTMLGVVFILQAVRIRGEGSEFMGKPSIDKYYFFSGKVAIFTTWALFILKAIMPKTGYFPSPVYLCWIAAGILWIGVIIVIFSMVGLGGSLKVGLPRAETTLQTKGIYLLSRNPLYLGIYLMGIASCLYFIDLINIVFTIYGIYIHHQIIKGEELFLARRFGKDWKNYTAQVRRYL